MDRMNHMLLLFPLDTVFFVLNDDHTGIIIVAQKLEIFFQSVFGKPGHERHFAVNDDFLFLADIHLTYARDLNNFTAADVAVCGFEPVDFEKRPHHHEDDGVFPVFLFMGSRVFEIFIID